MNTPIEHLGSGTGAGQDPAETLREIARELEGELTIVEAQRAKNEKRALDSEASAMAAIRNGDGAAAHVELTEMKTFANEMGRLDADAHVLRVLLAEIREFLDEHSSASGADLTPT